MKIHYQMKNISKLTECYWDSTVVSMKVIQPLIMKNGWNLLSKSGKEHKSKLKWKEIKSNKIENKHVLETINRVKSLSGIIKN
jgi:hypothetical protein